MNLVFISVILYLLGRRCAVRGFSSGGRGSGLGFGGERVVGGVGNVCFVVFEFLYWGVFGIRFGRFFIFFSKA